MDPSRLTYTKRDALEYLWGRTFTCNVIDGTFTMGIHDVDEALPVIEAQIRAEGLSPTVNWEKLEYDLGLLGDGSILRVGDESVEQKIDYLAARYVVTADRIKKQHGAEEQDALMHRLDALFEGKLQSISDSITGQLGQLLGDYDTGFDWEEIAHSIRADVEARVSLYAEQIEGYLSKHALAGTPDEWLLHDDAFITSELRQVAANDVAPRAESKPDSGAALYSLDDLRTLGRYLSDLRSYDFNSSELDEGRLGLDFAMLHIKTETLANQETTGDACKEKLFDIMNTFMQTGIKLIEAQLTRYRQSDRSDGAELRFVPYQAEDAWGVYHTVMRSYRETGDVREAMIHGLETGAQMVKERLQNPDTLKIDRYQTAFWKNASTDTLQQYMAGWDAFANSLENGSLELYLGVKSTSVAYTYEKYA